MLSNIKANYKSYEFYVIRNFTLLGNIFPQFLFCVLLMFIDLEKGLYVTGLWGWAYAMNLVIKNTVRKARPDAALRRIHVSGYSFASGHAVTSLALYFSMAKYFGELMPEWLLALVLAMPFLLGLTRIYLRVHFWEDVIGGWLIAYAYLFFAGDLVNSLSAQVYPWLSLTITSLFNV